MRLAWIALAGLLAAAPAMAQDSGEIAFWDAVKDSKSTAEFQAYLDAYPQGKFAELAKLRIRGLGDTPKVAAAPPPAAIPVPVPAPAQAPMTTATTTTTAPLPRATTGNASALSAAPAAPALGLASLRFMADQPVAATEPYLADLVTDARAKTGLGCGLPQSYRWNIENWPQSRLEATMKGIVGNLNERGYVTARLPSSTDNVYLVRVDAAKPSSADAALLLVFYLEEQKRLFLVACAA